MTIASYTNISAFPTTGTMGIVYVATDTYFRYEWNGSEYKRIIAKTMASAVADSRLGVFDLLISDRFDNIDLSGMMLYLVDVCDPSYLPYLAKQFDVDGWKGYDRCTTTDQIRELVKNGIVLHQKMGTESAIKKAISIIGVNDYEIENHVSLSVDGKLPDGTTITAGNPVWCAFNIKLTISDLSTFTENSLSLLKKYISYYKRHTAILNEIYIGQTFDDSISIDDEAKGDELTLTMTQAGDYNDDYNNDFNHIYYAN